MKKCYAMLLFASIFTVTCYAQSITITSVNKISNTSGNLGNILPGSSWFCDRVSNIGDLNKDGVPDIATALSWDNDGGTKHGGFYILFMNSDGTLKGRQKISQDSGNLNLTFSDNYGFGKAITGLGDLDGDGVIDLAVSAIGPGNAIGAVYILFMNKNGTVKSTNTLDSKNSMLSSYLTGNNFFGIDLSGIGDVNGDGIPDLAVGAALENSSTGSLYILNLKADGSLKGVSRITAGNVSSTIKSGDSFGSSVAQLGDLNGDGTPDVAVGSQGANSSTGAVYILFLKSDGTVKSYNKINDTGSDNIENNPSSYFGVSMGYLGDYDNDGVNDIIIGCSGDADNGTQRGAAYIVFLTSSGHVKSFEKFSDKTSSITGKLDDGDLFGSGVAKLDGKHFVVGARNDDDGNTDAGALYVFTLHSSAGSTNTMPDQQITVYPNPTANESRISYSLVNCGIVNIIISDITGKTITTVVDEYQQQGTHEAMINAIDNDLKPGMYLIKFNFNNQTLCEKLIVN
jgi:hypothetical protein